MLGLMQNVRLTVDLLLRRCLTLGAGVEVVSALHAGAVDRRSWRSVGLRALQLCNALDRMGVQTARNILSALDGRPIRENVINQEVLA